MQSEQVPIVKHSVTSIAARVAALENNHAAVVQGQADIMATLEEIKPLAELANQVDWIIRTTKKFAPWVVTALVSSGVFGQRIGDAIIAAINTVPMY